jgi:hypothetical protein
MNALRCTGLDVRLSIVASAVLCAAPSPSLAAAFVIIDADGPGEGLNDTTIVAPVGGNPGTIRVQQRFNVVQRTAWTTPPPMRRARTP